MRMTMRSLMTRVPPVTALRSPPLSRMTGADSPVIAASSTLAMPSRTSPSAGITSPVSHTTTSPFRSDGAGIFSSFSSRRRRAKVCVRAFFKLSACALPRPSAIASAKLANKTVNQSHSVICKLKPEKWPVKMSRATTTVQSAAPISVTSITGFSHSARGSSFLNESTSAGRIRLASKSEVGVFMEI